MATFDRKTYMRRRFATASAMSAESSIAKPSFARASRQSTKLASILPLGEL
jgi:hypothetical protein